MTVRRKILKTPFAERIYAAVAELPILDYHCHLSPREIFEDKPFDNIGRMWLAGDHYKWRLMRSAGIDEDLITGSASWHDKFCAFAACVGNAFGNPLRDWASLELEKYFECDIPLSGENADAIWDKANAVILKKRLSPKKLIAASHVEYIATTDDPSDSLIYHQKIAEEGFKTAVAPTFRADRLFGTGAEFKEYLIKLSKASAIEILDFSDFLRAIERRMSDFKSAGARFADIGIEGFPKIASTLEDAKKTFERIKVGDTISELDRESYTGYLYAWWLTKCAEHGFTVQLHLNVIRNANEKEFLRVGADTGYDTVGTSFSSNALKDMFNRAEKGGDLPRLIVYTLNPSDYYPLITLAGAFRGVTVGVPWWFNDHKNGIVTYLERMSELSHIESVVGMLTDSRSFLSYTRHDYFRMILSEFLSRFGEENESVLIETAKKLSYFNTKRLLEGK
ncbi:MAG: glucuronate isomerase [Clostridiales bacterium]|jgi:glucuronate isomerase|nr:glucuronate isomerase [Clostridiales bacterium]